MTAAQILARAYAKEHPGRVARLVEVAPPESLAAFLESLDEEAAAGVIARAVPLAGAQALAILSPAAAAKIVAHLDPLQVAPVLRRIDADKYGAIVAELPKETRGLIERLMSYRTDQAASRMDPRAPAVSKESTAGQTLELVRAAADGALNYVYVLEDDQRLTGVVSMRELMLAAPGAAVAEVMTPDPDRLRADDPLTAVLAHPAWKKTHALPVVDEQNRYLGVIRYSAFRRLETEVGLTSGSAAAADTSAALAELFFLGSTAIGRLAEAAVLGAPKAKDGASDG
jgi:magnesium transporter